MDDILLNTLINISKLSEFICWKLISVKDKSEITAANLTQEQLLNTLKGIENTLIIINKTLKIK